MKTRIKDLAALYLAFFRIGLFTFGGGYAMLPLIEREITERHSWSTKEEILDLYAMSQCTPGVIAVNTGTFIGNKISGFLGAVAATLGVITPSIIIITLIATLLTNFADLEIVQHAFAGIRVAVAALIFSSCIKLFKSAVKSKVQLTICIISFVLVAFLNTPPLLIIVASGLYGLFFFRLPEKEVDSNV